MRHLEISGEQLGIFRVGVDNELSLPTVARQVSTFMGGEVNRFYTQDLGAPWVDLDPVPSPRNPGEIEQRVRTLGQAGHIGDTGLQYDVAIKLDADGAPLDQDEALVALVKLTQPEPCPPPVAFEYFGNEPVSYRSQKLTRLHQLFHEPTELEEIDVAKSLRGQGLGKYMLAGALGAVHKSHALLLDVHSDNVDAQDWYKTLGFESTGLVRSFGIYQGEHLQMRGRVAGVLRGLGVHTTDRYGRNS